MDICNLWYTHAASDYLEALPIGNGRMGAMVSGGMAQERMALNEDTLWSGYAHATGIHNAYERYTTRIRKKILEERDFYGAEDLADRLQGPYNESYLCAGELVLDFGMPGTVSEYARGLDLRTGIAWVRYAAGGVHFTREQLVSAPDDVIVLHFECDAPGGLSFSGRIETMLRGAARGLCDRYVLDGRAPRHVEPSYLELDTANPTAIVYDEPWEEQKGLRFECQLKLDCADGIVRADANGFSVTGATRANLYIWLGTNYNARRFDSPEALWQGQDDSIDLESRGRVALDAAAGKGWAEIRAAHVADMIEHFDRVQLDIDYDRALDSLPTDERKRRYAERGDDAGYEKQFFDFGRYLLYSSSRPGTQAANLQGIWNWQLRPAWSCNYTTNINAQMNYWGAEVLGMPECHMPFMRLLDEITHTGALTARNLYNARGWCAHHNIDLWRSTCPIGMGHSDCKWSLWPTGGTWICQHIWEHYLFTRDLDFLRQYYHVLKGASLFAIDMMCDLPGGYKGICPATVPENRYTRADGSTYTVNAGAALDYQLVRDLFDCTEAAARLIGEPDARFLEELRDTAAALPPSYPVSRRDGSLLDWIGEDEHCQFINVLYGLYPGRCMSPQKTPELRDALLSTLRHYDHDMNLFANSWSAALWARMGDADMAYRRMRHHMADVTFDNLLGKNGDVFQIDSNLGGIAAFAEMLLQSDGDAIALLPALPAAWGSGSVRGLRARGGYRVDMSWSGGRLVSASICAAFDGNVRVRRGLDGEVMELALKAGERRELPIAQ